MQRIINEPTAAALAYGLDKGKAGAKSVNFAIAVSSFSIMTLEEVDASFRYLMVFYPRIAYKGD